MFYGAVSGRASIWYQKGLFKWMNGMYNEFAIEGWGFLMIDAPMVGFLGVWPWNARIL